MQIVSIEGTAPLPLLAWSPTMGKAKPAAKKAAVKKAAAPAPAKKAAAKKGGAKKK